MPSTSRSTHSSGISGSSNANNSEEIKKELVLAGRHHVTVIPVRVEDVVPNDAFAYEFATRQWIDLFQDWDREMETLARQITQILETAPGEKPAEIRSAQSSMRDDSSKRTMLIAILAVLLLAGGGALAWFKPWAAPSAPPSSVAAAETTKSTPVAAVTPPAAAPAAPLAALPAPAPEKPATAMAAPKPAPKPKTPVQNTSVQEAVAQPAPSPPPEAAPAPPPPEPAASSDDGAWTAASSANTRDGFAGYLKAYPSGAHASDAQLQLANLILNGTATGANFDGRWHTVWTCPNIGSFLGYSYQFDGQVTGRGLSRHQGRQGRTELDGAGRQD
jgi:hypothetical protein